MPPTSIWLSIQFVICVRSSLWQYSQHSNCISSSSSKSTLMFSKYALNFLFSPKYFYSFLRVRWDWYAVVVAFCRFWLLVSGNCCYFHGIILRSDTVYISCVISLWPSSPNCCSTSAGTSPSFPVAVLSLIWLKAFSTSLCKIEGPV